MSNEVLSCTVNFNGSFFILFFFILFVMSARTFSIMKPVFKMKVVLSERKKMQPVSKDPENIRLKMDFRYKMQKKKRTKNSFKNAKVLASVFALLTVTKRL